MTSESAPPEIDITTRNWEEIRRILRTRIPDYEVWAFGSRVRRTARPYSDIDLAVVADQPLGLALEAALADDFAESDLPFKVDVVDWATTSETFRDRVAREKIVIQSASAQRTPKSETVKKC
jgi:type I restriction enzyme S subunit